jgi:hypothetical protein
MPRFSHVSSFFLNMAVQLKILEKKCKSLYAPESEPTFKHYKYICSNTKLLYFLKHIEFIAKKTTVRKKKENFELKLFVRNIL